VETCHELALRYNDKSPLENMHASKLFELAKEPVLNVFEKFKADAYKQARKVCVSTILSTDNALHFDTIQVVKSKYEAGKDACDTQCRLQRQSEDAEEVVVLGEAPGGRVTYNTQLSADYVEVLKQDSLQWLEVLLHMADISTPLKPFWISKQWAFRVQDAFFAQGDEEKRLGIPVGMLNDRDKVNRMGSEHGFINFLVAPLIYPTVGVFPGLTLMAETMCDNMEEWKKLWVETGPSADEIKNRENDIQKARATVADLKDRNQKEKPDKPLSQTKTALSVRSKTVLNVAKK